MSCFARLSSENYLRWVCIIPTPPQLLDNEHLPLPSSATKKRAGVSDPEPLLLTGRHRTGTKSPRRPLDSTTTDRGDCYWALVPSKSDGRGNTRQSVEEMNATSWKAMHTLPRPAMRAFPRLLRVLL